MEDFDGADEEEFPLTTILKTIEKEYDLTNWDQWCEASSKVDFTFKLL